MNFPIGKHLKQGIGTTTIKAVIQDVPEIKNERFEIRY